MLLVWAVQSIVEAWRSPSFWKTGGARAELAALPQTVSMVIADLCGVEKNENTPGKQPT